MKLLLLQILLLAVTTAILILPPIRLNYTEQPMIDKDFREMSARDRIDNKATAASLLLFLKN